MSIYGIPNRAPVRYRVDLQDERADYWIGYDVPSFQAARELVALQPDTGHRFRIVAITERVEWESP